MNIFEVENQSLMEDENGYKTVRCWFSEVQEQTIEKSPNRCLYTSSQIKVVTQGGHEYLVPFDLEIKRIFPIQDGILIAAKYNEDMIYYRNSEVAASKMPSEREAP